MKCVRLILTEISQTQIALLAVSDQPVPYHEKRNLDRVSLSWMKASNFLMVERFFCFVIDWVLVLQSIISELCDGSVSEHLPISGRRRSRSGCGFPPAISSSATTVEVVRSSLKTTIGSLIEAVTVVSVAFISFLGCNECRLLLWITSVFATVTKFTAV